METPKEVPQLVHTYCRYGEIITPPYLNEESGMHRCLVNSYYGELLLVELKITAKEIENNVKS